MTVEGLYIDYTLQEGEKIDWAMMMMDESFIHDIKDSLTTQIEVMDKRIDNACKTDGGHINAQIIKAMATKRERLKLMLNLIKKELDEDANNG